MKTQRVLTLAFIVMVVGFLGVVAYVAYPFYSEVVDKILGKVSYNTDPVGVTAQVIESSSGVSTTGEVSEPTKIVTAEEAKNWISIPTIGLDQVPVIYPATNDYDTIEAALEQGVVHLAETSRPDEPTGATFIIGHSSNFSWAPGGYNYVFQYLHKVEPGNTIKVRYRRQEYLYTVREKKYVSYNDARALEFDSDRKYLVLMTCWPPNSNRSRVVVIAEAGLR